MCWSGSVNGFNGWRCAETTRPLPRTTWKPWWNSEKETCNVLISNQIVSAFPYLLIYLFYITEKNKDQASICRSSKFKGLCPFLWKVKACWDKCLILDVSCRKTCWRTAACRKKRAALQPKSWTMTTSMGRRTANRYDSIWRWSDYNVIRL